MAGKQPTSLGAQLPPGYTLDPAPTAAQAGTPDLPPGYALDPPPPQATRPDFQGALNAGYTPTEILNAMGPARKGGPDIKGARKAGYSDSEILHGFMGPSGGDTGSPAALPDGWTIVSTPGQGAPTQSATGRQALPDGWSIVSTPGHGIGSALASGVESAKADLEQGASDAITAAHKFLGKEFLGKIETNPVHALENFALGPWSPYANDTQTTDLDAAALPALQKGAQAARNSAAQTYQPGPNTPTSVTDAIAGSDGPLSAAARLGKYALYSGAQAAPVLGANLAMAGIAPEATLGRIGLVGLNGLSNLGGVSASKQAAGLDPNDVSLGDLGNAAAQTAMMAASPVKIGSGVIGRLATGVADGAVKGAVQPALNDIGSALQGGNLGSDPTAVAARIGSDMLNGAFTGAAVGTGLDAARESVGQVQNYLTTRKAGPNMQAYAAEVGPYQQALSQAAQKVQQANPGMAPEDVQAQASAAVRAQGITPPSFDQLSPEAQKGAAEQAALDMYGQRLRTMTTGVGSTDQPRPDQVFKGVLDDITQNLGTLSKQLKSNGLLTSDQANTLNQAISEAARHNRIAGENGQQFGYFDTLRDQVGDLPLDDAMKAQILQHLRVADIASQAGLQRNSRGFLERNSGLINMIGTGLASSALGGSLGVGEGLGAIGADTALHYLTRGATKAGLRYLDQRMGNQLPDILQRRAAIEQYADRNNLSSIADPASLAAMIRDLQSPAGSPAVPASAPSPGTPSQAPTGPVTSPGQGYTAPPQQGAVATPQTPQMGGGPQGGGGAPPSSAPSVPSGSALGPVTAADRLAVALSSSAPPAPVQGSAPSPQAVPTTAPAGPSLAQAMASVQQALAARQARMGAQAQAAFPAEGQNWSGPLADMLGVQHGPMMAALRARAATHAPEVLPLLNSDNLPPDIYSAVTNHVRTLRDQGKLPLNASAPGAADNGIRNPAAYEATVRQAEETANAIRNNHPRLADIVGSVAATKTKAGRVKAIENYLSSVPEPQRTLDRAILGPLGRYGSEGGDGL